MMGKQTRTFADVGVTAGRDDAGLAVMYVRAAVTACVRGWHRRQKCDPAVSEDKARSGMLRGVVYSLLSSVAGRQRILDLVSVTAGWTGCLLTWWEM